MWLTFLLDSLIGTAVLYVPGYLLLRCVMGRCPRAVAAAPAASCALVTLLAIAFEPAGIHADILTLLVLPSLLLGLLAWVFDRRGISGRWEQSKDGLSFRLLCLYVLVGVVAGTFVLIKQLRGPGSFFLGWDAIRHINQVQAFAESGKMSTLTSTVYETATDVIASPSTNKVGGFYPSAWHIVAALMEQLTATTAPIAVNACNFVFSSIIYPASMALFMSRVFADDKDTLFLGAFVTPCFVAFPWMFLAFGPLYPNVAGMAMLPAVAALWMGLLVDENALATRLALAAASLLCACGMALAHPNALFSLGVVGGVFVFWALRSSDEPFLVGGRALDRRFAAYGFAVLFCVAWVALSQHPALAGVTSYVWDPFTNVWDILSNIALLSYSNGWVPSVVPQPVLGLLVAIGIVCILREGKARWTVGLYLSACAMLGVCATTESAFKHILVGFWYSDHNRIAAMCAMFAVPLAARGLKAACVLAGRLVSAGGPGRKQALELGVAVLVACAILCPSIDLGQDTQLRTAFGALCDQLALNQEPDYGPIHWGEYEVIEHAQELVPHGAIIANYPYDGSIATYGAFDLHVVYRSMGGIPGGGESEASVLLRTRLNEYASDEAVRAAAQELGVQYVMLLHTEDELLRMYPGVEESANYKNWKGILSIDADTPGFELLYAKQDMAIYRIAY